MNSYHMAYKLKQRNNETIMTLDMHLLYLLCVVIKSPRENNDFGRGSVISVTTWAVVFFFENMISKGRNFGQDLLQNYFVSGQS